MDTLHITPLEAFTDNYIWLLRDGASPSAAVVDPGDAEPVLHTLQKEGLNLTAILITHHHSDHTGGIRELLWNYPQTPVYGPARESIPGLTHLLHEGGTVSPEGLNTVLRVLDVPGHTAGHIAYHGAGALFCGDTLFSVGCGRLFEGSAKQMVSSLDKLRQLPEETRVYCAHEYTLSNIRFAKAVEGSNPDLKQWEQDALALLSQGQPTLPTTLGLERRANPFLRWDVPAVQASLLEHTGLALRDSAEVFAALRQWKETG
ncbi:MAG: hydroxyacylglutathione hydrolase [Candidatus Omnitrophica bacterium]|nr:hydroxyacylglutathione hydrolase [Candidatus Omnitrophota bacterium]